MIERIFGEKNSNKAQILAFKCLKPFDFFKLLPICRFDMMACHYIKATYSFMLVAALNQNMKRQFRLRKDFEYADLFSN